MTDPADSRRGQTLQGETWIVELGDERPMGRRVAMLLKIAARRCGLKAVVVRDPKPRECSDAK